MNRKYCLSFVKFLSAEPRPLDISVEKPRVQDEGESGSKEKDEGSEMWQGSVYRLGLLFPTERITPQYIWIECLQTFQDDKMIEAPEWRDDVKPPDKSYTVLTDSKRADPNRNIHIWLREDFLNEGYNKSVSAIKSKRWDWRGPFIAMRYRYHNAKDKSLGGVYEDITPQDCQAAHLCFVNAIRPLGQGNEKEDDNGAGSEPSRLPSKKIQCVLIHCLGQVQLKKKPKVRIQSQKAESFELQPADSPVRRHQRIPV